ncbi:MAG: DUF3365 domain-containing protein [Phycisphaerae bacterium]|nr:DUF3365 domain-containing protein [Phycisphaerae bacterium]
MIYRAMRSGRGGRVFSVAALAAVGGVLASCGTAGPKESAGGAASAPAEQPAGDGADRYAGVNTVARDRAVWQRLLTDHTKIRRVLKHREEADGVGVVETLTESDDPGVTARIIDHALAMQARMKVGATVRVWDPVFKELFERYAAVSLEVTPTEKGVRVVERARGAEAVALMRAHAIGVSAFVRAGHAIGGEETPRVPVGGVGGPLPPDEVAIGGLPHRFLLAQPTAEQVALLRSQGVGRIVNFRKAAEHAEYDEASAAASVGAEYCNIPYKDGAELTDAALGAARAEYVSAAKEGRVLAPHCRTGNRVGPGLAAYLALDAGRSVEEAIGTAKAVGMVDPLFESVTRDYIRRESAGRTGGEAGWRVMAVGSLSGGASAQMARAEEARGLMFGRLQSALGEAMAKPGPDGRPVGAVGAIGVCRDQAPKIAQAVSREKGVMIGRTSDRLRSPGNTAPAWAGGLLAERPTEARVAANADGSLGVVMPIVVASSCLACHGDPGRMEPAVREAIAKAYPKDQATGYKEGDLRGWFWVEVPGGAR